MVRQVSALRGLAYAALALVAVVILQPLTAAQANPIIRVNVDGQPSEFVIRKSHGSTSFNFTVTFSCQTSPGTYGACPDNVGNTEVLVTFEETERDSYPDGWEVTMDLSEARPRARESVVRTVQVRLLEDEPERDHFDIGLRVTAQPVTNPTLDPLLGNQLGQSSQATDTVEASKVLNFGEQLSAWARNYMWPLLGAAVILLVAGVVLVERKRGALSLASDAPTQSIQAGRGTSFPIRIVNESRNDDRVSLSVANLPPDWTAIVPLTDLDLRGGERTQMWITLRSPPEALPGQSLTFAMRARSARGQRASDLPLNVTVVGGPARNEVDVPPPPPPPVMEFGGETVEAEPARPRRRRHD